MPPRLPSYLLVLVVALIGTVPAAGQSSNGQGTSILDDVVVQYQTEKGLKYLYDMKFDKAQRMFDLIDKGHPNHPIGPFLHALNTWWEILMDLSHESHDKEFFAAMEEVIERSDRLLKKDPHDFDAMFFKGAALGFRGRLRSNRGDWFQSAKDGLRAMDYVLGVARRDPGNADFAFGKGIYDYYAAAIPEKYSYVKPVMVFFPRGDKQRGIRELERTAKNGRFIQTEAAYFLLQIYYLFEDDYEKSRYYANWLRERHPDNSFFHMFEGRVYAKWGQWLKVREVFDGILDRYMARQNGYNAAAAEQALYFLARSHMAYGEYGVGLEYLNQLEALAARNPEKSYFETLGRLRQGMVYDALGRRRDAVKAYREVLAMKDWSGAHDRARRYLEAPYAG
ncbi:MAG: hypothetical protein WD275_05615 [Rhodothermales bacterium]